MNINYLRDYIDTLGDVLSFAHENKYVTNAVERAVSYSPFFQSLEGKEGFFLPIIDSTKLLKQLFPELSDNQFKDHRVYNQCLWAAESYLYIQEKTKMTFEAIFLYMPINKMYDYYPLYHEMDFSHIVKEFERLYNEKTVLSLLLEQYHYHLTDVCEQCCCSYNLLYSYKQRRRNIRKASVELMHKLANYFHVRIETISELKI